MKADVPGLHLHVIETASSYPLEAWVRRLDRRGIEVHRLAGLQRAESLQMVLHEVRAHHVLLVPPGYVPNPRFVERAARCLRQAPDLVGLTGPLVRYANLDALRADRDGELLPRALFSLAGTLFDYEPLAAGFVRVDALREGFWETLGNSEALRDVHAGLVSAGSSLMEDAEPAAFVAENLGSNPRERTLRRSGILRSACGKRLHRYVVAP